MMITTSGVRARALSMMLIVAVMAVTGVVALPATAAPLPLVTNPRADPVDWGVSASAVENIGKRTKHSKQFDNPDGTKTSVLIQDIHYEHAPDDWREPDLNFYAAGSDDVMARNPRYNSRISAHGLDVTDPNGKGIRWYTPSRPIKNGKKAAYSHDGLTWEYENLEQGVKITAIVAAPVGPQTYRFTYAMLGGAADFRIDGEGNAQGDGLIVPRPIVIGANGVTYDAGTWTNGPGPRLSFTFDDTALPRRAYPYAIDPTTIIQPGGAAGNDGEIRSNAPTSNSGSATTMEVGDVGADNSANRALIKIDTSSIGSADLVTSATLSLWEVGANDTAGIGSWATNLQKVRRDWVESQFTWNIYSTGNSWATAGAANTTSDIYAAVSATVTLDGTAALDFIDWTGATLDSDVQAFVDGSLSNYGWRIQAPDAEYTGTTSKASNNFRTSDWSTASERPKLTVVHVSPGAAITGTIGDGATEFEVREGGTIIITLTGVTWVADGGTFDAERQAIIDGLDSGGSETHGWNNEVRDKLPVTSVVRTSDTIATVTITGTYVSGYSIDANETVTTTVPASAQSGSALVATPTTLITAVTESMAISGTLGGSGGTPGEVRAGGETIIETLTNATWVAAGTAFNNERQTIINNLVSNQDGENGWNVRRSDFAVGDVVRTSDSQVTITLSAAADYSIPSAEVITATAPAAALVYGEDLTGSPTFAITPSFVASGNRVSAAIDLSSITDVALCAFGWDATTPTSTTATFETSIDGGANFSTATNGECPAGISVGASLASITDFRSRVNLTTSDSSVTPLVNALALVIQDTSGQALYYQLNTTPGVTITDRSDNANTGTMSFPISTSGITSSTGVLESTRSAVSLEQLLSVGDIVSPVTGAAASGNIFNQTETGFGSLPFQSMMQTLATGGELPLKFVWVVAIGLFSIALGVVALHLTGSLMISGVGMGAGLSVGAAIGAGLIPGWTVILFVILALALIVMRSRGALPL